MFLLLASVACTPVGDLVLPDPVTETRSTVSSGDGTFEVEIEIAEGVRSFQLTTDGNAFVLVEALSEPDGDEVLYYDDWYGGDNNLTAAVYPGSPNVLDWPIREEDGELEPGAYTVELLALDAGGGFVRDQELDVTVHTTTDDDLGVGLVRARLLYADDLRGDDATVAAVETAVDLWREIWAAHGIELEVEFGEIDVSSRVPSPPSGSDAYADAAGDAVITMVLGETISGESWAFGVSGGIPGSLGATRSSAVAISVLSHAGPNGEFNDIELAALSETMAHETGHYMGLFHPVEITYAQYDALDDTPECRSESRCIDDLGGNNLYPYPICWSAIDCVTQDQLTDAQVGVLQRYTGTR